MCPKPTSSLMPKVIAGVFNSLYDFYMDVLFVKKGQTSKRSQGRQVASQRFSLICGLHLMMQSWPLAHFGIDGA